MRAEHHGSIPGAGDTRKHVPGVVDLRAETEALELHAHARATVRLVTGRALDPAQLDEQVVEPAAVGLVGSHYEGWPNRLAKVIVRSLPTLVEDDCGDEGGVTAERLDAVDAELRPPTVDWSIWYRTETQIDQRAEWGARSLQ
jgi:hypothetical protein